jgi:hypothetical protein
MVNAMPIIFGRHSKVKSYNRAPAVMSREKAKKD